MSKVVFIYRNGKTYTARGVGSCTNIRTQGKITNIMYRQFKSREGILVESKHNLHVRLAQLDGYVWYKGNGTALIVSTVKDKRVTSRSLFDIAESVL